MMNSQFREQWIDAVKGLTIILVVFHHVFQGVQTSLGFSDLTLEIYSLTNPIRMPLFFLVAGFFAKKSIEGKLSKFIETKVAHFIYLYVLWSVISITIRSALSSFTNNNVQYTDILNIFWEPTFTIWFLYALLIAFVVARITRALPPIIQIIGALTLAILVDNIPDGSNILLKTIKLYPFFIIGVYCSYLIRKGIENKSALIFFAGTTLYIVGTALLFKYEIELKSFIYYIIAAFGVSSLMAAVRLLGNIKFIFNALQYSGERSIYIYLMHFLPAAGSRVILEKIGFTEPMIITLVGALISVLSCLAVCEVLRRFEVTNILFQLPRFSSIQSETKDKLKG